MSASCGRCVIGASVLFFCLSRLVAANLPPGAKAVKELSVLFRGESQPLRVLFYSASHDSAGVVILSPEGNEITSASLEAPLGLFEGTGVYDLTGDGSHEIVLVAWVGGKTLDGRAYRYRNRTLHEIFRGGGNSFKIVRLRGDSVIAIRPTQYGTLSNLYVWQNGSFEQANDRYPEFYAPEIEEQQSFIYSKQTFPAYIFSQSCRLAAQSLLYSRNYDRAQTMCGEALELIQSGTRVKSNMANAPAEELYVERQQAAREIQETLKRVATARKQGLSHLPE